MQARMFWLKAWKQWELRRQRRTRTIIGEVELPMPGDRYVHAIDVKGWARGRRGEPARVRVAIDGKTVRELVAEESREDLAARYPDVPGVARAGFRALIKTSELPARRLHWVAVTAAADGASLNGAETVHAFPIVTARGTRAAVPRQAYGFIWDRSASGLVDAKIAVAGTADDAVWRQSGEASAAHIAGKTGVRADDVVLEIGCGVARIGVHMAARCREWIGCDVSRNMLRYASRALDGIANARLVHLNGYDLDVIPSASVDVVYCAAVFMHIDEWDRYRYVREAFRVLRPGGRVYYDNFNLLTPDGWSLFEDMARLDIAQRPPNVSKSSTPEELRCYAEHAGFDAITVDTGGLWVAVHARKPAPATT